ncbi:hypothetical protein [Butyrivibrio sp. AE3006]|uniref:hypothetical protein n=1 Tax=Butyrivibrio sp. AE3006 TaxID=1280673 RepID=UPI0004070504|nr:hypothetical protein [Butyrivibrio sp. AE3006]
MENIKLTTLDLMIKNSLDDIREGFSENEIAKAIKVLIIVKIIGIIIFTIFSIMILFGINSISDGISHFVYHYYGGFCEYYR